MHSLTKYALAALAAAVFACDNSDEADQPNAPQPERAEVTLAYGDSNAIVSKVNHFREHSGTTLNTEPGATGGRREINWDGVGPEFISPLPFPASFFNLTGASDPNGRKRGLIYVPTTTALLVSDQNFTEVDPVFKEQFKAFSKNKLFSPKGTNISDINFQVPGSQAPAFVTSFGVILCDVDNGSATTVEAYDGEILIAKARAQAADKGYSFVGVHTHGNRITRIKITAGNKPLTPGIADNAASDIVVIDDLIYSEPQALQSI